MIQSKLILLLAFIRFFVFPVTAQTIVEQGNQSGTWAKSESPYTISGDITVPDNETLTIEPGVEVLFSNNYKITVNGRIKAIGTDAEYILFTVTDTSGFYTNEHTGWGGFKFSEESNSDNKSELTNCIIEYGKANGADYDDKYGGAINLYQSSSLTLRKCTLRFNYALAAGGAIYVNNQLQESGSIIIDSCSFIRNSTGSKGVYSWGGAISGYANLHVYSSLFEYNTSGVGGALNLSAGASVIKSSIFQFNTSIIFGGAIHNTSEVDIFCSYFYNNGSKTGGAIFNGEAGVLTLLQTSIRENYAIEQGFGIYNLGTLFTSNSMIGESKIHKGSFLTPSTDIFNDGEFESDGYNAIGNVGKQILNRAKGDLFGTERYPANNLFGGFSIGPFLAGYGIDNAKGNNLPYLLPENDVFGNPRIYGSGPDIGAAEAQSPSLQYNQINVYPDSLFFNIVTIDAEKVLETTLTNANHSNLIIGDIIAPENVTIKLKGSEQPYSDTIKSFGLVSQRDTVLLVRFNPTHFITLNDTIKILNNSMDYPVVNIKLAGEVTTLSSFDGNITSNTTWDEDTLLITGDVTVEKNATLTIKPGSIISFSDFYALNVNGALQAVGKATGMIVFKPNSENGWRGIRFLNKEANSDSSILEFCEIQRATATSGSPSKNNGGGVYISHYPKIKISNCIFHSNEADISGGAIFMEYSEGLIEHNFFFQNSATLYGGGIAAYNSTGVIRDNEFYHNAATINGGALFLFHNDINVYNNMVSNNEANVKGGGIYLVNSSFRKTDILNNIICNNEASSDGGGIFSESNGARFINNTVVMNKAGASGGGYYGMVNGTPLDTIINCIIWGNDDSFGPNAIIGMPEVQFSNLTGSYSGEGNISVNPEFLIPSEGVGIIADGYAFTDWRLSESSLCVNKGKYYNAIGPLPQKGYYNQLRLNCYNDTIDMGAIEYITNTILPVLKADTISVLENSPAGRDLGGIELKLANYFELQNAQETPVGFISGSYHLEITDSAFFNHEVNSEAWMMLMMENNCGITIDSFVLVVNDQNEKPRFDDINLSVPDTAPAGYIIDKLHVWDEDNEDTIRFTIIGGNSEALFDILNETGNLVTSKNLSEALFDIYQINIMAEDKGGLADTAQIEIAVNTITLIDGQQQLKPYTILTKSASGSLQVNWNGKHLGTLEIWLIDINGKTVLRDQTNSNQVTIPAVHLKKGVYILKLKRENQYYFEKLIIN